LKNISFFIGEEVRCNNVGCYNTQIERIIGKLGQHLIFCSKQCLESFYSYYDKYEDFQAKFLRQLECSILPESLLFVDYTYFYLDYAKEKNLPTIYGSLGYFRSLPREKDFGFFNLDLKKEILLEDLF